MEDPALIFLQQASPFVLTLNEAAEQLGITRRAVERLIQRGTLSEIPFKGRRYIASYDLDIYKARRNGGTMVIESDNNLYNEYDDQGKVSEVRVNPHLMSELQTPGSGPTTSTYTNFHSRHISAIADLLDSILPKGYQAVAETSLQIVGSDISPRERSEPDVNIYKRKQNVPPAQSQSHTSGHLITSALELEAQQELIGIMIYKHSLPKTDTQYTAPAHEKYGTPITRLELLSPANMPGGSHHAAYKTNRNRTLVSGIAMVEIDYLHESMNIVPNIPQYPDTKDSDPYNICVSNPRTQTFGGYTFGFDISLPIVPIPLDVPDQYVALDFGAAYQNTWVRSRALAGLVDYSQPPVRFESYSQRDQQLIQAKMQDIQRNFNAPSQI